MITKFDSFSENEGIRTDLLYPLLIGGTLLISPMNIYSKTIDKTIDNIETTSSKYSNDKKLDNILDEIKSNLDNQDSSKYEEMFNKLNSHLKEKYNYEIKEYKKIDEVTQADIDNLKKQKNIFELIGWLSSICFALCGLPQAWTSYKRKESDGHIGMYLLWIFGEIFGIAYACLELGSPLPLLTNYVVNILLLTVILYFKKSRIAKDEIIEDEIVDEVSENKIFNMEQFWQNHKFMNKKRKKTNIQAEYYIVNILRYQGGATDKRENKKIYNREELEKMDMCELHDIHLKVFSHGK